MPDLSAEEMAARLMAPAFARDGADAAALSDPIADTPMVVTLDQLRPYDHDPRVTRNPAYDDIKASIRERGLDAPPAITRRPGSVHYMIRNGGNTRLAILRELWGETREERFFRLACLFRPWPARGEIVALTGHLAENELRGGLSFIERALGIEKARSFYEEETGGQGLSQSELARRLTADGYPVHQSHISRMQDAVRYLLPAIPTVLYGGLGRHQVERLAVLRRASERIWDRRVPGRELSQNFGELFQDVLAQFDVHPDGFSVERVQDELVGRMAEVLSVDYDTLSLEIDDGEARQRALIRDPLPSLSSSTETVLSVVAAVGVPARASRQAGHPTPSAALAEGPGRHTPTDRQRDECMEAHIVSPASTTDRLQSIQRMVADHLGDRVPDFESNALRAIPVQAGGLHPITDVWFIEPGLDAPEALRAHIAQFAHEIASEAGVADHVEARSDGIGYLCAAQWAPADATPFGLLVLHLLHAISGASHRLGSAAYDLAGGLGRLLHGQGHGLTVARLSDEGLVKLFRLLRLARRLHDLENVGAGSREAPGAKQRG